MHRIESPPLVAMKRLAAFALALACLAAPARAEVSEVRFARQLGLGYLQLYVMEELKLVEQQGQKLGLTLSARYIPLGGPAPINDALLTGSADYGAAGVPPFIILWDKTRSNLQMKGVVALNAQPAFLNTNKPSIHSLQDFTDQDRIAVPGVKLSLQAILLEMAAEKAFGAGQQFKLDPWTVTLAHPDGAIALLSGKTEITGHFTSPPFQYQELQDPKIHRVLSSYEITDGPSSFSVLWTTEKFRSENPKAYRAVLAAVEEATAFINTNRGEAARIFIKVDHSTLPQDFVEGMLNDKDIVYSTTPLAFQKFTDFMSRIGSIGVKPASWKDLFFPDIHDKPGS
jgi:NitT/TauT family transport system substrate-binding protein